MFRRIKSSSEKIRDPETAVAPDDFVPATRDLRVKQTDRGQRAANHDRGLDEIGPDHRFDAAERRVDRGQMTMAIVEPM